MKATTLFLALVAAAGYASTSALADYDPGFSWWRDHHRDDDDDD